MDVVRQTKNKTFDDSSAKLKEVRSVSHQNVEWSVRWKKYFMRTDSRRWVSARHEYVCVCVCRIVTARACERFILICHRTTETEALHRDTVGAWPNGFVQPSLCYTSFGWRTQSNKCVHCVKLTKPANALHSILRKRFDSLFFFFFWFWFVFFLVSFILWLFDFLFVTECEAVEKKGDNQNRQEKCNFV